MTDRDGQPTERYEMSQPARLALFVLAFFVVWSLRATLGSQYIEPLRPAWLQRVAADGIRLLLWVVPVILYLRYVDRVHPASYLRLNTRICPWGLRRTILWFFFYLAGGVLVQRLLAGGPLSLTLEPFDAWYKLLLALLIPPIAEEILFRGFLLRKFGEQIGFWPANLLTAALFAAIHWPFWLYTGGQPADLAIRSVQIFLLGCVLGYLVKQTNSVWAGIGGHLANNLVSAAIVPF